MDTHPRLAIAASFAIMAIIGTSFVFMFWAGQSTSMAVSRSIAFLVVIGAIHVIGYLLYAPQFSTEGTDSEKRSDIAGASPSYWPALKFGVMLQAVLAILTALMLDGGRSFTCFKVAFVGYWIGILMIMIRRPSSPSRVDIILIRYGIILLMILTGLIAPAVWSFIGESTLSGWQRLLGE